MAGAGFGRCPPSPCSPSPGCGAAFPRRGASSAPPRAGVSQRPARAISSAVPTAGARSACSRPGRCDRSVSPPCSRISSTTASAISRSTPAVMTLILVVGGAAGLLGIPLGARLSNRWGRRPTLASFSLLCVASGIAYYWVPANLPVWTAVALGACFARVPDRVQRLQRRRALPRHGALSDGAARHLRRQHAPGTGNRHDRRELRGERARERARQHRPRDHRGERGDGAARGRDLPGRRPGDGRPGPRRDLARERAARGLRASWRRAPVRPASARRYSPDAISADADGVDSSESRPGERAVEPYHQRTQHPAAARRRARRRGGAAVRARGLDHGAPRRPRGPRTPSRAGAWCSPARGARSISRSSLLRSSTLRIAILDGESRTVCALLRRSSFEMIVRRPVHPAALRLLLLHALYRGPEKRRTPRVSVGAPVTPARGAAPTPGHSRRDLGTRLPIAVFAARHASDRRSRCRFPPCSPAAARSR